MSIIVPNIDCKYLSYVNTITIINCFIAKMFIMNNCLEYSKDDEMKYLDCIQQLTNEYKETLNISNDGYKRKTKWYYLILLLLIILI